MRLYGPLREQPEGEPARFYASDEAGEPVEVELCMARNGMLYAAPPNRIAEVPPAEVPAVAAAPQMVSRVNAPINLDDFS